MKRIAKSTLGLWTVWSGALYAQPQPAPGPQDPVVTAQRNQPVYQSQDQQPQSDDRERVQQQDNEPNSSKMDSRDRPRQQAGQQNPQNPTYNDQYRGDVERQSQDSGGEQSGANRDRKRDQNGSYREPDRDAQANQSDLTHSYQVPQNDRVDSFQMSPDERSGFRAGLNAGRSDRAHGRQFSPNVSATESHPGEDKELYHLGFREGYQRGYYPDRATSPRPR
jgi:hypothetical protein